MRPLEMGVYPFDPEPPPFSWSSFFTGLFVGGTMTLLGLLVWAEYISFKYNY